MTIAPLSAGETRGTTLPRTILSFPFTIIPCLEIMTLAPARDWARIRRIACDHISVTPSRSIVILLKDFDMSHTLRKINRLYYKSTLKC